MCANSEKLYVLRKNSNLEADYFIWSMPEPNILLRRTKEYGDQSFISGQWHETEKILDYMFKGDFYVDPIAQADAMKNFPEAFAIEPPFGFEAFEVRDNFWMITRSVLEQLERSETWINSGLTKELDLTPSKLYGPDGVFRSISQKIWESRESMRKDLYQNMGGGVPIDIINLLIELSEHQR